MANGLGAGDSIKSSDTFSFFRGERDAVSPGRRDVEITDLAEYLNDPDVLDGVSAPVLTGATSATAGVTGTVPAPSAGDESKVLNGAGSWVNASGGLESRTSDYTAESSNAGKMWMRTDGGTSVIKAVTEYSATEAWTTKTSVNSARLRHGSFGEAGACLIYGGDSGAGTSNVEEWNGTTWDNTPPEPPSLPAVRQFINGDGTVSAGIFAGGYTTVATTDTITYDGSAWTTESGSLTTARYSNSGFGTQSAFVTAGGETPSFLSSTESYNGTSWSTEGSMSESLGRASHATTGTQSAGLIFAGYNGSAYVATTRTFDGSSWSNLSGSADYPISVGYHAGCGSQSSTIGFGGTTGANVGTTATFDGATWTSATSLNVSRQQLAKAGNASNALSISGFTTSSVSTVEEYTPAGSSYEVVTFTTT